MEGPSVHATADELQVLEGETVEDVSGNAKQPIEQLEGKTVDRVRAVKKRLFIDCGPVHAVTHFLMYGTYRLDEERDNEERLKVRTENHTLNIYSASVKILEDGEDLLDAYDRPSEDVLKPEFDREKAVSELLDRQEVVASVLLDQDVFGGVGNIVKNEVLWDEGIDPRSTTASLPEETASRLVDATVRWAREWYAAKTSDIEKGFSIYYSGECETCGNGLERDDIGEENERKTLWCPNCQERW